MFWRSPTITDDDRLQTDAAEADLRERKKRGAAVHRNASEIVAKNNLAEKFHTAFTLKEK